jgi:hypothetical protein
MYVRPGTRRLSAAVVRIGLGGLLLGAGALPAAAVDQLLFCNQPERIRQGGAHADAQLKAGQTYRIFFHYRNGTRRTGPLVVSVQGTAGKPLPVTVKKGIGDPHTDPGHAGRQAMARFLKAPEKQYVGPGRVRFPITLKPLQVGSGVLTVRTKEDARLRIYYAHNRNVVKGAKVVAIDAPRREYEVVLTPESGQQYFRIGLPVAAGKTPMDGAYGVAYSFKVNAPPGSKVRVAFSPRGGKAGVVGTVGGLLRQTPIVGASAWARFSDAVVGKDGLVVTTLPFGGVFYPVELAFKLLR